MQPTLMSKPFHHEGRVYEREVRRLAHACLQVSRPGRDHTNRFRALPARTLILDGEVCIFDQQLISRFEWLYRRPKGETATPALFMVFDCLRRAPLWGGGALRADRPLISPSGDLAGEAPLAERDDDQAAARVGGIRLGMARGAERHQAVEIEVRAPLGALDDVVDLEARVLYWRPAWGASLTGSERM